MNFLSRLTQSKKESPYYKKLSQGLQRKGYNLNIQSAYFLFGVPFSSTSIDEIKRAITNDNLGELKKTIPYDVKADNIELYLLEEGNNKLSIVVLLDPYELYSAEDVLEVVPVKSIIIEKEKIFPQ